MTEDAVVKDFDPDGVVVAKCQVTTFQDQYFITNSVSEAKEKIKEFIKTIETPFRVSFSFDGKIMQSRIYTSKPTKTEIFAI